MVRFVKENNLKADFNQGLDVRLLEKKDAELLNTIRPITVWKFAFDSMKYREYVERGIQILKDAKVNIRQNVSFYVYCDGEDDVDDAIERCRMLKSWGTHAYSMINMNVKSTKRMKVLKRWTRPMIFFSSDYDDFFKSYKGRD